MAFYGSSSPRRRKGGVIAILAALALVGGLFAGLKFNGKSANTSADRNTNCASGSPRTRHHGRRHTTRHAGTRGSATPSQSQSSQTGQDDQGAQNGGSSDQPEPSGTAQPCDQQSAQPSDNPSGGDQQGGDQGGGDQQAKQVIGPLKNDFVDIRKIRPNAQKAKAQAGGSTGTFTSDCGTNQNKHRNNDNEVITPGVANGAHHLHDLVGNEEANAQTATSNQQMAASGTTCAEKEDISVYFWPVLRSLNAQDKAQLDQPAVQDKNNLGEPVLATTVKLEYRGNPTSKVVPQPEFLRAITGDAKSITNGLGNTRPTFTCTGFENRVTNKYPLCPSGSNVETIKDFPSCWDGQNLDSANHRDHLKFPDANTGACPAGTKAVPQLRMTLIYAKGLNDTTQGFDVDGFATERHDPASDHAGFINVMSNQLNARVAKCINSGKKCT